jgi:hypothetical protein
MLLLSCLVSLRLWLLLLLPSLLLGRQLLVLLRKVLLRKVLLCLRKVLLLGELLLRQLVLRYLLLVLCGLENCLLLPACKSGLSGLMVQGATLGLPLLLGARMRLLLRVGDILVTHVVLRFGDRLELVQKCVRLLDTAEIEPQQVPLLPVHSAKNQHIVSTAGQLDDFKDIRRATVGRHGLLRLLPRICVESTRRVRQVKLEHCRVLPTFLRKAHRSNTLVLQIRARV